MTLLVALCFLFFILWLMLSIIGVLILYDDDVLLKDLNGGFIIGFCQLSIVGMLYCLGKTVSRNKEKITNYKIKDLIKKENEE